MHPDDGHDYAVRDRLYGRATSSSEGRRNFVAVLLAVSIFVLIVSISCRQATAPGQARNILEAGLVSLTDLDQLLADEGPAIRQSALESQDEHFILPGYPLDIVLTREEVISSSDEQLRALILGRSSALLYAQGIEAFDRTGNQDLRRFSVQGILEYGVGQISETNHNRATFIAIVAAVACAASGAIVAASGTGWGRMRGLGFAAIAGAIPVIVAFFLLRLVVGAIGGDDPFIGGYRDITNAALGVPLRNGLIVLGAGVVVVAAAIVLARIERMMSGPQVHAWDDDY